MSRQTLSAHMEKKMFTDNHIRKEVALACRFLAEHRMMDLWGHLSAVIPDSELLVVTPKFGECCLPRTITEDDLLVIDIKGNIVDGNGGPPLQLPLDLSIYSRRLDVRACVYSTPKTAMAFGICRRPLKAVVHQQAQLASRIGWLEHDGLFLDKPPNRETLQPFEGNVVCHQPGIGMIAMGPSLLHALSYTYNTEYLAQVNYGASKFDNLRILAEEKIRDLHVEIANPHHAKLFQDLAPAPITHPWLRFVEEMTPVTPIEELKTKLAFTSRLLWDRGTLVTFLEHVSHRVAETNLWLMTVAKAFNLMTPADVATLDYKANWIAGPPPPRFKRLHNDIFVARPDVMAIVHTHDVFGRIYVMGGVDPLPIFRNGLIFAVSSMPPTSNQASFSTRSHGVKP